MNQEYSAENKRVLKWLLETDTRYSIVHKSIEDMRKDLGAVPAGDLAAFAVKVDAIKKSLEWLNVIFEVEKDLPPHLLKLLNLRRDLRTRKDWTAKAQVELNNPSRQVLWQWSNEIVNLTARLAAKRGLL